MLGQVSAPVQAKFRGSVKSVHGSHTPSKSLSGSGQPSLSAKPSKSSGSVRQKTSSASSTPPLSSSSSHLSPRPSESLSVWLGFAALGQLSSSSGRPSPSASGG